jgi:uncharacterized Zn finger protein
MCKHVAATLYGAGARLDERPQLLFVLRGVDESELLSGAAQDSMLSKSAPDASGLLDAGDVAALFGLDMAEAASPDISTPAALKPSRRTRTPNKGKASAAPKTHAARNADPPMRIKAGSTPKAKILVGKQRGQGQARRSRRPLPR